MKFSEYVNEVRRTYNPEQSHDDRVVNFALGLVNEAVEAHMAERAIGLANHIREQWEMELGDVAWYTAALADTLWPGCDLDAPNESPDPEVTWPLLDAVVCVTEEVKKRRFHGRARVADDEQRDDLRKVWRSLQRASNEQRGAILVMNVAKLRARWPDGFKPGRRADTGAPTPSE